VHSIHEETIIDEARWSGFYSMPVDKRQAAIAGATIVRLVREKKLVRHATSPRALTETELLAGEGANATIGLRLAAITEVNREKRMLCRARRFARARRQPSPAVAQTESRTFLSLDAANGWAATWFKPD